MDKAARTKRTTLMRRSRPLRSMRTACPRPGQRQRL